MYHSSHYVSGSRLEYIAYNSVSKVSDRVGANTGYSVFSGSVSRSWSRCYSQKNNLPAPYSVNGLHYNILSDLLTVKPEYHFIPDHFLKPGKTGLFVSHAEEVKSFVEETFRLIFDREFPEDIKISVVDEHKFRILAPSPAVIGLSLNRSEHGLLSEIFVLHDSLNRVMLTIGHELGHVLTPPLENAHDEEAKAYAFSWLWMKTIKENNIADLGEIIVLNEPAENGLHDVAFKFVHNLIKEGKNTWEVYLQLVGKVISMSAC